MIDKGKYSSHGTMIKKLPNVGLAKWQKTKLAVIHPIPNTQPRQKFNQFKQKRDDIKLCSKTYNATFKFQQQIKQKPVEENLTQPFLYIEKVIKKTKVDQKQWKDLKPFVASIKVNMRPASAKPHSNSITQNASQIPPQYSNLFDYEQDRRKTANKLFTKLMNTNLTNLKDIYLMWNKKINLKQNPQINIKHAQFIEFIKQLVHQNLTQKQIKHFFDLYKNKNPQYKQQKSKDAPRQGNNSKDEKQANNNVSNLGIMLSGDVISIQSLSYNYEKFLKNQVQITNIMSQKALKQRYNWVKRYLSIFDQNYPQLKTGMNSIKSYQQSLRQHFTSMFNSYTNPYQQQILQLKKQLQKPIIKYDKHKKDLITSKIQQLQNKNKQKYQRTCQQYKIFMENYQEVIVKNHDLFFNKRIICKLVLPIMNRTMYVNKEELQKEIEKQQAEKQKYLECLSDIVMEMDKDKKILGEDCFTLADMVEIVMRRVNGQQNNGKARKSSTMKNSSKVSTTTASSTPSTQQSFILTSMKKLIKQIKKQYLLKNELYVQSFDLFPADQQIPLTILHTCFQMQCTKVLSKNHIWTQLLSLIPQLTQQSKNSKFHQQTISCNQCLGYLKKYFIKLDENLQIERNKSKQISLLIQNANLDSLWYYNTIVEKVVNKLADYNSRDDQEEEEEGDRVTQLNIGEGNNAGERRKKVGFADIAESLIEKDSKKYFGNNEDEEEEDKNKQYQHEQNIVVKDILKAIFNEQIAKVQKKPQFSQSDGFNKLNQSIVHKNKQQNLPQSLQALKTLSKSFFVPQKDKKLSTNAFDIRFYEKIKNQQQQREQQQQILRIGSSMLLSHLPKPQQLQPQSQNPLKISQYLQKSITSFALQQKKLIKTKQFDSNVKHGVDHNYYKDNIKLQNRPTRYDSDGKSKYSVLFPVGYYEGMLANDDEQNNQKWYLRSHHVQTLTQNPLSKKDNLINTQYQSKLDRIPLKKRPQQFVIQENVNRKDNLIQSLQQRISSLKQNLQKVQHKRDTNPTSDSGQKVPNSLLNKYLTNISQNKQDKDLQMAAYQAVLYDLRRNERNLVINYRDGRNEVEGEPENKWWEKKDSGFNVELKKERMLVQDSFRNDSPHKKYVEKLKNREIY